MYESEGIRHIEIHHKAKDDEQGDEEEEEKSSVDSATKSLYSRQPQHSQLLRADSDQVSLDSLLKAVMDISGRLDEQEEKLKVHEDNIKDPPSKHTKNRSKVPETAVRRYKKESSPTFSSDSDFEQSQTSSKLSAAISRNTASGRSSRSSRVTRSSRGFVEDQRNLSFNNDSAKKINVENQRLLREILHTKSKTLSQRAPATVRPASASSINRSREQKEIERENMRFLNRLQSVKPTKTLARDTLLNDHSKNLERSSRISKTGNSRPSSAVAPRRTNTAQGRRTRPASAFVSRSKNTLNDSFGSFHTDIGSRSTLTDSFETFDSSSVLSSHASTTSVKSNRSASTKKKKVQVHTVWEPGW